MIDPELAERFAEDIVLLQSVGIRPVVVHGGGPQIGDLLARLGIESEFRDGLRVTDAATLDVVRMVLVGRVNRDVVAAINTHGPLAVGLSGEDAGLIVASARHPELGFVGDVEAVDPGIIERLLAEELVPVIATIGSGAERPGLQHQRRHRCGCPRRGRWGPRRSSTSPMSRACGSMPTIPPRSSTGSTRPPCRTRLDRGELTGGMIPKIAACLHALGRRRGLRPHPGRTGAARAAARTAHRRGCRHHDHRRGALVSDHAAAMGADADLARCPLMPTYGAPSVLFVRGRGTELWDARRPAPPRLHLGPGGHGPRPRPPCRGRGHRRSRRPPCCTCPTSTGPSPVRRWPGPWTG